MSGGTTPHPTCLRFDGLGLIKFTLLVVYHVDEHTVAERMDAAAAGLSIAAHHLALPGAAKPP
jgi:hypothetical protein